MGHRRTMILVRQETELLQFMIEQKACKSGDLQEPSMLTDPQRDSFV